MGPTRAALYVRISEDKAGESLGVQRQEQECRQWAERNGWTVAEVYRDNDLSASKSSVVRPEYERMLSDVRAGKRDGIICWSVDRLLRQLSHLADLIEMGVLVGTVEGKIDLTTVDGRFMATVLGGVARQEVERKSERHKTQIKQAAYAGKAMSHKRPFGWTDNRMQTLHPVEAPAMQNAAADLLAGATVRGIVVRWNRDGLTTPRYETKDKSGQVVKVTGGGAWSHVTVRQLFERYSNAAIPQHNGEPLMDVQGQWTPILDRDTFLALRASLANRAAEPGRVPRSYLLSGVLTCGRCGRTMRGGSRRYKCVGELQGLCSLTVRPDLADPLVTNYVLHRLNALSGADLLDTQLTKDRAIVEARIQQLQNERKQIANSGLDLPSRIALLKALEADLRQAEDESVRMVNSTALSALIGNLVPFTATLEGKTSVSFNIAVDNLRIIREKWLELDQSQQRMLAKAFGTYTVLPGGRGADRIHIERLYPQGI